MKRIRKIIGAILLLFTTTIVFYWLSIAFPQIFFESAQFENLCIYHHGKTDVRAVGERALAKIKQSSFYDPAKTYRVFLTDSAGEYAYYTSVFRASGGVFLIYANGNVFVRPALVEQDRLIGPSGSVVAAGRPLNYFVAHEVAHRMTYDRLGFSKYLALNEWVREGVADQIGRDRFDYEQMLADYRRESPTMDRGKSGLYLKYQLLVEFAQRHKNLTIETLLEQNPNETEVEADLKNSMQ